MKTYFLKSLRKIYRFLYHPQFELPVCELNRDKANKLIYQVLSSDNPCMISRLGSIEIGIICNYLMIHGSESLVSKCINFVTDNTGLPWWDTLFFKSMKNNAGIFPESIDILERFSERYLHDIPEIDLLGSFNYAEKFMPLRSDVIKVHLECLYPFWTELPWTLALKGKRVLVVHPFAESIRSQSCRRNLIFKNQNIWPEYNLITLCAVQSNAGNNVSFRDWFEALKWMEDEIAKIDFDICILGCGAYGLPLAATIKRMGKKAIHMGGGTQLLFGIKGKRWDNNSYHWKNLPQLNTNYSSLYNEYWIRPSLKETPQAANSVEGACYW